jgi:hypothetical protein
MRGILKGTRMSEEKLSEPQGWAEKNFGTSDLGDKRRTERVVKIASALAANPGKSIPEYFDGYDLTAAYDFFNRDEATPENIQKPHLEHVRGRMREDGVFLLLEDSSDLTWPGNLEIEGLEQICGENINTLGFILHTVLAVKWPKERAKNLGIGEARPPVEVLGLAHQKMHSRVPRAEKKHPKVPPERWRESMLWPEAGISIGPAPDGAKWIFVCDRGADVYEHIMELARLGYGFRIRAAHNRVLADIGEAGGERLFDKIRSMNEIGSFEMNLRSRPGKPARNVVLQVSSCDVKARSPQRVESGAGALPSIECAVVRAWEEGGDLEWIILCEKRPSGMDEAREIVAQYATRWLIEEYHKGLKSGLGAEKLRLETKGRLFAAIAIMAVIAVRLLWIKEMSRIIPDAPAKNAGVSDVEILILEKHLERAIKTVRDVALAIGALGGHQNRKGDGMPGWKTLYRGAAKLAFMVMGYRLAMRAGKFD